MPYIGRAVTKSSNITRQTITSSTSATHTLTTAPKSEQQLLITINGVKQHDSAFTVSGATLTLSSALVATDEMEIITFVDVGTTTTPGDGSVTSAKLDSSIDNAITANTAKVTNATHTGDVTGSTALTIANDAVDIPMLSATGTADGTTFLRGDNTWAAAGGGKVLQVVTVEKTDTFSTTSTSMVDVTGLTVNITPSAATSKILVLSTVNGSQGVAANRGYLRLMRDSTAIFIGDAAGSRQRVSGSFGSDHTSIASPPVGSTYLDSPNTTSAVTYKWQIEVAAGSGSAYINVTGEDFDESGQGRWASNITLMEIGA